MPLHHVVGSAEQSDLPLQFAVWWEEVRRLVGAGEPPWISERLGGGAPLFANGQTGIPWPLQLPVWLFGPELGTAVMGVLKLAAAAWGMVLWLRVLGCGRAARLLGAGAFALSLDFVSWLPVPLTWVMAATPWCLWLLVHALRGLPSAGGWLAVLLGGLLGWSTHPETAAFLALALAVVGLVLTWGRWRRGVRVVIPLVLSTTIGLGFGLPVVLTVLDSSKFHAAVSPVEGLGFADKLQLATLLLVPFRLGHPADGTFAYPFPHAPVALACGSAVLLVLLAGTTRPRHRRWVLALSLVLAFALGLFFELPGFRGVGRALPVLGHMTWPRVGFLIPFALIALAALRFPQGPVPRKKLLVAWLVVQGAVLALTLTAIPAAGKRVWPTAFVPTLAALCLTSGRFHALLPAVAALEAGFWSAGIVPVSRPGPVDPLLARLGQQVQPGERVLAVNEVVPANLLARMGFEDLRSHDPVRPRALATVHATLGASGQDLPGPITRPWAGFAGAWGVRWLLTGPEGTAPAWAAGWEEVDRSEALRLYRNARYLPPLRLAASAVTSPGNPGEGGWEALDFSRVAVVPTPLELGGNGHVTVLERRPWRIRLQVEASGTVLAVLHTPKAPGWRVFLDGKPAAIVTANLGGMGVVVPEGVHRVTWSYRPPGLWLGLALGVAGVVGAARYGRRG